MCFQPNLYLPHLECMVDYQRQEFKYITRRKEPDIYSKLTDNGNLRAINSFGKHELFKRIRSLRFKSAQLVILQRKDLFVLCIYVLLSVTVWD